MSHNVVLKYSRDCRPGALRELRGDDELSVVGTKSADAIALLERLFTTDDISNAKKISIADRDRLLALIYIDAFGSKISTSVNCLFCKQPFDVNFSLNDLIRHANGLPIEDISSDGNGQFHFDGTSFRLPTGEDELVVQDLSPELAEYTLLYRCTCELQQGKTEAIQKAMDEVAPLLQQEMTSQCPECGCDQKLLFDVQSFLLTQLKMNKKTVVQEIHVLARCYKGWTHSEILALPRSLRKMYLDCILAEFKSDREFN